MPMCFIGNTNIHKKHRYSLQDFATLDLLTFQRGSQPHVALLNLVKVADVNPRKVHAISSIAAMVQLVQGGFGVATLPRAAVARLSEARKIKALSCTDELLPRPIHASYRADPTSPVAEQLLKSALEYSISMTNTKIDHRKK